MYRKILNTLCVSVNEYSEVIGANGWTLRTGGWRVSAIINLDAFVSSSAFAACYIAIHISFSATFSLILTPTSKWNAKTRSYFVQINIPLPSVLPFLLSHFLTVEFHSTLILSLFCVLSFFFRFLFVNDCTLKLCSVDIHSFVYCHLVLFSKMREEKRLKMTGDEQVEESRDAFMW